MENKTLSSELAMDIRHLLKVLKASKEDDGYKIEVDLDANLVRLCIRKTVLTNWVSAIAMVNYLKSQVTREEVLKFG